MAAMGVLGHRGSPDPADGVRENTLEAFIRAPVVFPTAAPNLEPHDDIWPIERAF